MQLIFLRHGETVLNEEGRYQGRYQGHGKERLSSAGKKTVQKAVAGLGRQVEGMKIVIMSSDLPRAWETAEMVRAGIPRAGQVISSARWREIDFGDWAGLTYQEISEAGGEARLRAFYDNPWKICPPGGETLNQLTVRVKAGLNDLLQVSKHTEPEVCIVVSHAGAIRAALSILDGQVGNTEWFWQTKVAPGAHVMRCMCGNSR